MHKFFAVSNTDSEFVTATASLYTMNTNGTNGVAHGYGKDFSSLQEILTDSLHDLRKIHARLTLPHIQKQLEDSLHDTENLPHKKISTLSSEIVDVLYATDRLLQPGNLVLADHFLGTFD